MTPDLRLTLLFLLALCAPAVGAQPSYSPGRQVIGEANASGQGHFRLSSLFEALPAWWAVSSEGYRDRVSPDGLSPVQAPAWQVFVDGIPVDLDVFGTRNLNELPITLSVLDSVETVATPALVAGRPVTGGVLSLHTHRPAPGVHLGGHFAAGNEVGDPGPFRYTPEATPNIDRIGPQGSAEVSVAGTQWHARAGIKSDEHHATDERINRRVNALYRGVFKPRILLLAPFLTAGYDGDRGTARFFAGHTRLRDLRFLEAFGQEVPVTIRRTVAGLSGSLDGRFRLRYRASAQFLRLGPRENRQNLDPTWREDRAEAGLEVGRGGAGWDGALGATVSYRHTGALTALRDPATVLPTTYLSFSLRPAPRFEQHVSAGMTLVPAHGMAPFRPAPFIAGTSLFRPSPGAGVSLTVSYAVTTPEQRPALVYEQARGYTGLSAAPVRTVPPPFFLSQRTLTADFEASLTRRHVQVILSGGYRRFRGLSLSAPSYHYDPGTDGFMGEAPVHLGVEGQVFTGGVRFRFTPDAPLRARVEYRFTRPVSSGSRVFWQAWAPVPWHRGLLFLSIRPAPRFELEGRARIHSRSRWPAYGPAFAETGRFNPQRPAYALLDVSARKRLWAEHVIAGFTLQNLTNAPWQPHPAGAVTHMTLYVFLSVVL